MSDQGGPRRSERVTQRLAHQWAALRQAERERMGRRPAPSTVAAGTSNFTRAEVPYGVDLAAAWAWRFLVIVLAGYVLALAVSRLTVLFVPLVVSLLLTALVLPIVDLLERNGVRRGLAALVTLILTLATIAALLTFAGRQVANGANDLRDSVVAGLGQIKDWLKNGPLHASDTQVDKYFSRAQDAITQATTGGHVFTRVTEVTSVFADFVAGFFIVVLSTYFFLADGDQIWAFLVRLAPRAARERMDSSGRVAWFSLTKFVQATVIVAATDAILIAAGAAVLRLPFVLAIGVLVFLGAFVPILGAVITGGVAVLVALVDQGPIPALVMLGWVIVVNQIESHGLQPFLMGRWVRLHPLGVVFAIGTGVLVAGIPGALIAVPMTAAVNAVVQHLAGYTRVGDHDQVEKLQEDYAERGETAQAPEGRTPDEITDETDVPAGEEQGS